MKKTETQGGVAPFSGGKSKEVREGEGLIKVGLREEEEGWGSNQD